MIKPLKLILITVCSLTVSFGLMGGCASTGVIPFVSPTANIQASTFTEQAAEKICNQALLTQKLFFGLVKDNHDFVVEHLPKIYAFAQDMQVRAPDALRKANRARRIFKYNRTADNQASMDTVILTLTQLMSDMQTKTNELKAAKL